MVQPTESKSTPSASVSRQPPTPSILVVEDRVSFGLALQKALVDNGVPRPSINRVDHVSCLRMMELQRSPSELLLLDAYDLDGQQEDPTRSRLAAADVLLRLQDAADVRPVPRVIVYSLQIDEPRVSVPLREFSGLVDGYFAAEDLADAMGAIIQGGRLTGQAPAPTAADYELLGVTPEARICELLRWMRTIDRYDNRQEVWLDLVCAQSARNPSRAVRARIGRAAERLLGWPSGTDYRDVIELAREVACVPFDV